MIFENMFFVQFYLYELNALVMLLQEGLLAIITQKHFKGAF